MDIQVDPSSIIVFDLDDTLYNEVEFLKSAYSTMARELSSEHWKTLYADMFSRYRSKKDVFQYLEDCYKVPKEALITQYREHRPNITAFPGVLSLMAQIKQKGGKIGVLTDGRGITQRNKLKALGLLEKIDHLVISEDLGTEKPHPNNYLSFEERFPKGNYYYIADNCKKDFVTPNERGWQTIGLIDQGLNIHHHTHEYLDKPHAPHDFILCFAELTIA